LHSSLIYKPPEKIIISKLTAGCVLSVDMVDVVIGLVVHCGDARLVGDVIECDDVPDYGQKDLRLEAYN
jgi:hypothetical protein